MGTHLAIPLQRADWAAAQNKARGRRVLGQLSGPAVLSIVTIIVFWKLTLTTQFTWLNSPDLVNQVLPWYQFQAAEWHRHRLPLWDPHHWAGQSLIGQLQPGVVFPLNWILFVLPFDRTGHMSLDWMTRYFVFIHYLAALFTYCLCRDLNRSKMASVLAGIAFGLAGCLGTLTWPQMLNGAIWGPLILLFFLRAMRGARVPRNAAIAGAAFAFSVLGGHHQIPTFFMLMVAGVWLFFYLGSGRRWNSQLIAAALIFAAIAASLSLIQTLPAYEYWNQALRWVGAKNPVGWSDKVPYTVHAEYSFHPVGLLNLVLPNILPASSGDKGFVGFAIVTLAVFAVFVRWSNPEVRLFSGIALGGLVFSLGGRSLLHGVAYSLIPSVHRARSPEVSICVFHLGLAVLAAYGLDGLQDGSRRLARRLRCVSRSLWTAGALLWLVIFVVWATAKDKVCALDSAALPAGALLLLGAIWFALARGSISWRGAAVAMICISLLEINQVTTANYFHREQEWEFLDKLYRYDDLAAFLRKQPEPVRVAVDKSEIAFNFGDWYGIDETEGYAGVTKNIIRVAFTPNARLLLGENFIIGRKPSRERQTPVYERPDGLKIFRDPDAFPRVWPVHQAQSAADVPTIFAAPLEALRQTAFFAGPAPKVERCNDPDEVVLLARESNRVVVEANMRCRGVVVVGETFSPGWVARIDDIPARIYEAYGVVRAVEVAAGRHRIVFDYRPRAFSVGVIAGVLGLIVLLVIATSAYARGSARLC